jgi:putative hydrolase of the HAD superfamily
MNEPSKVADGVDGGQMKKSIPITTLLLDSFTSSCFVHVRKPDAAIFRLALDIVHAPARQAVYIENTPMFVLIAEGLGIRSILHTNYESTRAKLSALALRSIE